MNLAACAKEANECDGISTQQKQGFAALNMRRKKGKYTRHNFVLERIQFSCSISAGLIVRVVESEGMLQKRGTRNKHGERRENNKKRNKRENWKFNDLTVWDRIQLSFCSLSYR